MAPIDTHIIGAGSWLTIVFRRIEPVLEKRSKESKGPLPANKARQRVFVLGRRGKGAKRKAQSAKRPAQGGEQRDRTIADC